MPRSSNSVSNNASSATTTTTPVKEGGGSARSLHSPVPRSRLNSKDAAALHQQQQQQNTGGAGTTTTAMTESSSSLNAAQLLNHNNLLESPRQQQQQQRTRFNSRDIPRSYAGQYSHAGGTDNDLLPLECLRSHQFFVSKVSFAVFLSTYMTLVLAIQFCATLLLATTTTTTTAAATETTTTAAAYYLSSTFLLGSWTVTNVVHCIVTLMYLHWSKGSYLLDEQGELNAMTVWEQLEATHESTTHMRRTLLLVPTVLTYAACVTSHFEIVACLINVLTWSVSMLAKSPIMNGVRLFGINRTAGIDDDDNNTNNNNNYYDDSTMIDAVVKKLE